MQHALAITVHTGWGACVLVGGSLRPPQIVGNTVVGLLEGAEALLPSPCRLASHMRIHAAEGLFYRDVLRDACQLPCRIIPPASLDITSVGKVDTRRWGRDQKLAALAAWRAMSSRARS